MIVSVDSVSLFGMNPYPVVRQRYYNSAGALQSTTYLEQGRFDMGVYRTQLTDPSCSYDRVDVDVLRGRPFLYPSLFDDLVLTTPFSSRSTASFTATGLTGTMVAITPSGYFSCASGDTVTITFSVTVTATGASTVSFSLCLYDSGPSLLNCDTLSGYGTGTHTITLSVTAAGAASFFAIQVSETGSGSIDATITAPNYYLLESDVLTETKTIDIDCECLRRTADGVYLMWLNHLGGYDTWLFTAYSDYLIELGESGERSINIFPDYPNSYGEFADTLDRKETFRKSRNQILVRSQHLTEAQVEAISAIKSSTLVQIVSSIYDRRTVIVDRNSFTKRRESEKLFEISFTITYTDDLPSQRG